MTMSWLGIYSYRLTESKNEFFTSIGTPLILFPLITLAMISSGFFIYEHLNHFTEVIETAIVFIGGTQGIGMFVSYGLQMNKIKQLHISLQEFVDHGKSFEWNAFWFFFQTIFLLLFVYMSNWLYIGWFHFLVENDAVLYKIYWKNEKLCRKLTITMYGFIAFVQSVFITFIAYFFYGNLTNKCDTSDCPLPFQMIVPFDTDNVFGWFSIWFLQNITAIAYALCTVSIESYFFCCCFYINAICEHFHVKIKTINENITEIQMEKCAQKFEMKMNKLKGELHHAVEVHHKLLK